MPLHEDISAPSDPHGLTSQSGIGSAVDQYLDAKIQKAIGSCRDEDIKQQFPIPFVLKFPFIDEVVRHNVNCSQYRYVTIITDGAINPNPNQTRVGVPRNNLVLEFDDGTVWKIEHSIWNLNIARYGSLKFTNLNYDIMIGAHPCNGYGNISLIFTMEQMPKFDMHIQPPHFCITGTINSGQWLNWWAGKYNLAAGNQLVIPYIPYGYKDLRLQIYHNETFTYEVRQICCGDVSYCLTTADEPAGTICVNIPIFSDRIHFRLSNTSFDDNIPFCIQGTWIRKGKF